MVVLPAERLDPFGVLDLVFGEIPHHLAAGHLAQGALFDHLSLPQLAKDTGDHRHRGISVAGDAETVLLGGEIENPVSIRTEGVGDFRNVLVHNCIISRSNRGLSIQIRDGGNVENVHYSDIIIETRRFCPDWWGTAEPIVLTTFNRDAETKSGSIRNVSFRNITCKGENGVLIHGNEKNRISDISFENVQVELTKTSKWACGLYDLRPCLEHGVESYKNAGFFLRYADNVTIEKSRVRFGTVCDDYAHALDAENCENIELVRFVGEAAKDGLEAVLIR